MNLLRDTFSLIVSCTHHFAARKLRVMLKLYSAKLSVQKMMHKITY